MFRDRETLLERDEHREPHVRRRHVRNETEYNEAARERLALKFAMVGTEEEAREARGIPATFVLARGVSRHGQHCTCSLCKGTAPVVVPIEPAWRPADGGGS